MGKKGKGKQKQDEKLVADNDNTTLLQPPLTAEGVNVPMMSIGDIHPPIHPPSIHHEHIQQVSQDTAWGSTPGAGNWDSPGGFAESGIHVDNWTSGTQENNSWHHTESLLDPPPVHSHNILPTIHEQVHEQSSSGHFGTRTESIAESDIYSDDDYGQETHRGLHSPYPQSRTGTATAAASAMGSPRPAPPVSLAQAAAEAAKLNSQHMSHASEAARKLEESKSRQNDNSAHVSSAVATPAVQHVPLAPSAPPAPDRKKLSTASAYAALHEKKNAPSAAKTPSAQPSTSGGKNTWQFRPVHPGNENARVIPTDPSWIMTGGNEWSNKHRTSKSAPSVPTAAYIDEDAWNRHLNHYRQAQQMQQAIHDKKGHQTFPAQHRPQHNKHHSHPGHPTHHQGPQHPHERQHQRHQHQHQHQHQQPYHPQQPQRPPKENQKWQHWGKGEWNEDEEEETEEYSESGEETVDEWATAAQHTEGWGQSGGWEQQTRFAGERGRVPDKKVEEHWGQGEKWGEVAGSAAGWRREAGEGGGWGEAWGKQSAQHQQPQHQHQQHLHQHQQQHLKQQSVHRGHHPGHGNEWGPEGGGWGQEASSWGKTDENTWGLLGGGGGDRGKASEWEAGGGDRGIGGARNSRSEWPTATQHNQAKVAVNVADVSGSRNAVSAQQRSQILNSFLSNAQGQKHPGGNTAQPHVSALAASQKGLPKNQVQHDAWGEAWEADDDGWGSLENEDGYDGNRRVHFSPKTSDIWGGSPRSVPSKTLVHAQQGFATTSINDASNVRFVESRGAAFAYVSSAFFGNARLARERIHWMFPVNKDKRVAAIHAWVQKMSFNIGTFGLMKFLQTRERGALFLNTIFRMHQFPQDPAFDWLTFNQLQGTMDKTLQESVAFYDPARLVIVFVYLPSQTGNSVAIWRIKVNVPDNARIKYQQEVSAITKTLRKDTEYIVMVDEIPPKPKMPQKNGLLRKTSLTKSKTNAKKLPYIPNGKSPAKEKRKWWRFFS